MNRWRFPEQIEKHLFSAQFQRAFSETLSQILMIPSMPLGENDKLVTCCSICLEFDSSTAHFMSSGRKSQKCLLSNMWWSFVLSTKALWVMALCAYEATKSIRAKPNWEKRPWHIYGSQWTSKRSRNSVMGSSAENTPAYQQLHSLVSCYRLYILPPLKWQTMLTKVLEIYFITSEAHASSLRFS